MKMNIALLPGDGIGPEVISEAVKVLKKTAQRCNHKIHFTEAPVGAAAIDQTGDPYPQQTHELCMNSDAVLFGAIGHPRFDNDPSAKIRPEQGLLTMRKKLGLYANVRPVETFDALINKAPLRSEIIKDTNFVCIRELTGGIYFGERGKSEDGNTAWDTCTYTRIEIERILKLAFEYARNRRGKLCVVDKANVLESSRLWRKVAQEMETQNQEIEVEYLFVDAAAMRMIQWPKGFDVMVTSNMFGDILTDEASVISGSMGLMPSASIGEHTSVFEPIHGSYPQAAGKNIANPLGAILSAAMMLEYQFNLTEEARIIREAVGASLEAGIVTQDICETEQWYYTNEIGDWLIEFLSLSTKYA